jgi:hypothetical protein
MRNDPLLAIKTLPPSDGYRVPRVFKVEGGLHYIKGNSAPYFSLTYAAHRRGFPNQCYSGGAGHDEILKHFPQFADLAALHLSDINGVPMHAEANGWFWLAGYYSGAGEKYHAGASKRNFPCVAPPGKPWQNTEYREPTPDECLAMWAEHGRISVDVARTLAGRWKTKFNWPDIRACHKAWIEGQAARWKAEAEACIQRHNLKIYGDKWEGANA